MTEPTAFLPWDQRFDAVKNDTYNEDSLWPEEPTFLPRGWELIPPGIERLRVINDNPILATFTLSINQGSSALKTNFDHATEFLNSHLLMASVVEGCSCDDDLPSYLQLNNVFPGPNTLIDDSKLPDFSPLLVLLKITSKLTLVEPNKVPINDILKKGLPLKGIDKELEDMIHRECSNEVFYRTFHYIIMCFMLGTYDWLKPFDYDFQVQTWIAAYFTFTKRSDMVKHFTTTKNRDLMLYACTAFLINSISLVPSFSEMVHETYDWDDIKDKTRQAFLLMREELHNSLYTGRLNGPSDLLFVIAAEALPQHSKEVTDTFKTQKNDLPSILPNITTAADRINIAGVGSSGRGPFDLFDLQRLNSNYFKRAFNLSLKHGVGVTKASLDGMEFSPRGLVTVNRILKQLDNGKPSSPKLYRALGPGDLSKFMAFVAVQREMLQFDHKPLSRRVAEKQMAAIRRKYVLYDFEPVPEIATHLPFCPSCKKFKQFPVDHSHQGMAKTGVNPFTGTLYCVHQHRPACCHLVNIPMVGYSLTVCRKTWIRCCYCTEVCRYGNADMQDSYWWCGTCERY